MKKVILGLVALAIIASPIFNAGASKYENKLRVEPATQTTPAKKADDTVTTCPRMKAGECPYMKDGKCPCMMDGKCPCAKDGKCPCMKDGKCPCNCDCPMCKEGKCPMCKKHMKGKKKAK